MSSNIFLDFDRPVGNGDWRSFCRSNGIEIGNDLYNRGKVVFAPMRTGSEALGAFARLCIGSRFLTDLAEVGATARLVAAAFPCSASPAPELAYEVVDLPCRPHRLWLDDFDEGVPRLPTDDPAAWTVSDGVLVAAVPAGEAAILGGGILLRLEIDGVHVASAREPLDAMLFAGRFGWEWWRGPRPTQPVSEVASTPMAS